VPHKPSTFIIGVMSFRLVATLAASCFFRGLAYEWAGLFRVPYDTYLWTAQKDHDAYTDPSMKIVALPASNATAAELANLESLGESTLNGMTCTDVSNHGVFTPMEGTCYNLVFDTSVWQTLFRVDTSSVSYVAFFAEHLPTEFETNAHYLKDDHGHDIEPVAELPTLVESTYFWESVGAAILVNLITLVGVVLSTPCMGGTQARAAFFEAILSSFAAGALLACAFFLLLFEATHLVGTGWTEEVDTLWRWGTAILAGFFLPVAVESASMLFYGSENSKASDSNAVEMGENLQPAAVENAPAKQANLAKVLGAVLIGDFFHNLCDGFFIAAAFKGCGGSFAWGVVIGTCLHEFPQELADYAILTGSDVGFSPLKALVLNFGTGLSVLLGVLIVQFADVSDAIIGLLLAFGGGTYLYLASVICMPKLQALNLSAGQNLMGLLAFVLGCVLIGLVLLDHQHCSAHGHSH